MPMTTMMMMPMMMMMMMMMMNCRFRGEEENSVSGPIVFLSFSHSCRCFSHLHRHHHHFHHHFRRLSRHRCSSMINLQHQILIDVRRFSCFCSFELDRAVVSATFPRQRNHIPSPRKPSAELCCASFGCS